MTLPLALASQVAVGASFALISRHSDARQPWARSVSVWALLCLEIVVVVPPTAYGLWRFPAWSMHYLWEPGAAPSWAMLCLLLAAAGLAAARAFIVRNRSGWAWAPFLVGLVATAAVGTLGMDRIGWVGTSAQFQARSGDLLPLGSSGAGTLMTVGLPLQAAAWFFTLWRLHLLDRAAVLAGQGFNGDGESIPEISAQLLSVAKPAGTRQLS